MERTQKLQDFMDSNPWADVMANDSLLESMSAHHTDCAFEQAEHLLGYQPEGKLLIAAPYQEAWATFLQAHSEFKGPIANMLVAFGQLNDHQPPTVEAFEEIAARGLLAESNAHAQAESDQREISKLKNQISKGNSRYESFNRWNVRTMFNSEDLDKMNLAELRALATKVEGERNLRALPQDQRRAVIKQSTAYQAPAVREIPIDLDYIITAESKYFQIGQTVKLNGSSFMRMSRADQKRILERHGIPAVQGMLDKLKQS
jgi:hypothetical protein